MPKVDVGRPKEIIRDAPNNLADSEIETPKPKLEVAKNMGFSKDQVSQFQKLADNPEAVQKAIATAQDNGEIVTRSSALNEIKQAKKPHVTFNSGNGFAHALRRHSEVFGDSASNEHNTGIRLHVAPRRTKGI